MSRIPDSAIPTGRFAPSPTGPVHQGTLAAALASYLDVKVDDGQWLLRIDDIDQPREVPGAADQLLSFLEKSGFEWHGPVVRQTACIDTYHEYLEQLRRQQLTFACTCSRKQLSQSDRYPGTCRNNAGRHIKAPHAIRMLTDDARIRFVDRVYGLQTQDVQLQVGDFVVFRKDGLFAYQFAVVIDDAIAGINRVTRGKDLLDSTPRQILLQQKLNLATPLYAHIPLIYDQQGQKLSKSSQNATALKPDLAALTKVWNHLQPINVSTADFDTIDGFWKWARQNWQTQLIRDMHYD